MKKKITIKNMNFVKILINATKETCNEYIYKKKYKYCSFCSASIFQNVNNIVNSAFTYICLVCLM